MEKKFRIHYAADVRKDDESHTIKGSVVVTTKTKFEDLEMNSDILDGLNSFVPKLLPGLEVLNVKFLKAEQP
jgi:hypothetical protein